jgi:hypothetical protein
MGPALRDAQAELDCTSQGVELTTACTKVARVRFAACQTP